MTKLFRRSGWAALLPAIFLLIPGFARGQAASPARAAEPLGQEAREEEEQDPAIRTLMGLTRFRPDSKEMALAKQLLAFRNGARTEADSLVFFRRMAKLGASMTDLIRLQTVLRDRAVNNPALIEAFFGKGFPQGGTEVEKALLSCRRKLTMDAVDFVAKSFKGRIPKGNASVWLGEVGKWPGQDPRAMTLSTDVDISFVSNDKDLTMEMKASFEGYIKGATDMDTLALDSVCTAHGRAGPEVYITNAGQAYGQEQFEKGELKRIELDKGRVDDQPRPGGVAILNMTIEAEVSGKPGVIVPPRYNKEPGLSMEMVRHFNHDIVNADHFDTVDSILKASKYVDRNMDGWKGKPPALMADAGLVDFSKNITEAVQKTPDWLRVATLFDEYFSGALRYTVVFEGTRPLTRLSVNQRVIRNYFHDCNKLMWDNVVNGLKERLVQIEKRGAELESAGLDQKAGTVKLYWDELVELKDVIVTERMAMDRTQVDMPADIKDKCDNLLKAIDASCAKLKLRAITPDMLKQKAFIEEMIKARTPMLRGVAIVSILEGSVKIIEKGNSILDFVDDTLLGELRGQNKSFDEFVIESARLNAERAKGGDEALLSRRLANMKNMAVQGIQAVNIKANEVIQATSAGRGLMKGFMAVNLAMEVSAYQNAWQQDGYSGLAAELLRRHAPGVSSMEAACDGNYGRALADLVYIIFPPAAIPEGIMGMGDMLYGYSYEAWWSAELELFTDTLYEWAEFSTNTTAGAVTYRLEFLRYEGRPYMRADLDKGTSRFFEDPAFSRTLEKNLAATDAFLGYCEEGQKHQASGYAVRSHFQEKARKRWDEIKRDYVKRMIARLEQRRASEKSIESGEINTLFAELQKTARELRIEEPLFAAMDKEWDSGVVAQWWSRFKSGKRAAMGQPPSEAEMTRAATVVRTYVEAYREVLEARRKTELTADAAYLKAGLSAPAGWDGDGMSLRWLSGTPLLACQPKEDVGRARKWVGRCSGAFDQTLTLLNAEREKEIPGSVPDPAFDARIAAPYMAATLWKEAYGTAGSLPLFIKQNALKQHQESQLKLMEDFLAYYRERSRPVAVQVCQLIDGKRTEVPVGTALVQGRSDRAPGEVIAFSPTAAAPGSYVASGLQSGDYAVTVTAEGYRSEQGAAAAEGVLTLAPGGEAPPPLRFWLEAEKGTGPLSAEIRSTPAEGRISNGLKAANVAVLAAFVTAQADSGELYMEWLTGNEELGKGMACREVRFVGHGRSAGMYRVTLFVRDAKGRTAVAETILEVTPAEGYAVTFAPHRGEIGEGEGELIRVESPRGDDWSYRWTLRDGTDRPAEETDFGTEWMADYRHFPGKTVSVTVKARNKRGEEAEGRTTIVMRAEERKGPLAVVIQPAQVRLGQSIKAVVQGTGSEDLVENWAIAGESGGASLACAALSPDGREAIFTILGDETGFEGAASRSLALGCQVRLAPTGEVTNLVSAPITLLPLHPAAGAGGAGGKPWLRLPFNWAHPVHGALDGHTDFAIRTDCGKAETAPPKPRERSTPMTVMGYKGWLTTAYEYPFAEVFELADDEELIPWPLTKYEGDSLGNFIGFKDKCILGIRVGVVAGVVKGRLPTEAIEKPFAAWIKQVDRAFADYLAGLPPEGATLTLGQRDGPLLTIQPKPGFPWLTGGKPALTAVLAGAPELAGTVSFTWEGDAAGTGDTVWPAPDKSGKFTATVIARGATSEVARASISWAISDIELTIDRAGFPAAPVVGDRAALAAVFDAPADREGLWLKWESDLDVRFEGADEMKTKVTATFTKPGPTRVWVTLYRQTGATHVFLAEAVPIEVEVGLPKLALTAAPDKPYVDQVVTVTLSDTPRLPGDLVRVNWSSSDNVREAGPAADERTYAFRSKDANPVTVSARVQCRENGEELGGPSLVIQPRAYEVKVSDPKLQGPAPLERDSRTGRLVESPRGLGVGQRAMVTATIEPAPQKEGVRYRWSCTPEGATLAEAGGREATVSASRPGAYSISVTALDGDGVVLGSGQGSFTVAEGAEAAAPDRKAAEVERHYKSAMQRWGEGQLVVAIEDLKLGLAIDPAHAGCLREMDRMTRERTAIEKAVAAGEAHLIARRYESAGKAAEEALALNGQYAPARRLKEVAQGVNRGRDELIVKTLREAEQARKACEFTRAIQALDGPALTYAEIPAEALGQIAALRADCVARQAELERRKAVLNTARTAHGLKKSLEVERLLAGALERKEEYFGAADQWHVQQMEALREMAAEEQRRREKAAALWKEAVELQRQERLVEADKKMVESLKDDPDKTPANNHIWWVLSMANEAWRFAQDHAAKGELEEAISQMTLSLKGAKSAERARALEEMKKRLQKKKADQQWGMALTLLGGDLKAAAAQGTRSLELDPEPPRDRVELVRKWSEAGRLWEEGKAHANQKRYAEALVSCEASVNLVPSPEHVEFLMTLRKTVADLKPPPAAPKTGGVTKPASAPSKPVAAPVAKPVAPPVAKPVAPPVAKPVAPPVAKPVAPPVAKPVAPPVAKPVTQPVTKPVAPPVVSSAWPIGKWKLSSLFEGKKQPCGQAEFLPGGAFTQNIVVHNLGFEVQQTGRWTWNGKVMTLVTDQAKTRTLNQPWQAMEKGDIETIRGAVDSREGDIRFRLYWTDEDDEPVMLWFSR